MGLNKEQGYRINHAERHGINGADPIYITDLQGNADANDRLVSIASTGEVTTTTVDLLYITDAEIVADLENDANWSGITYNAGAGFQGQRVVSTIKSYFYECVEDDIWVRYPIAMNHFHMYLDGSANDMLTRNLLENESNWTSGAYTGSSIEGTLQGQAHFDSLYKYDAVADNIWIRIPRQ